MTNNLTLVQESQSWHVWPIPLLKEQQFILHGQDLNVIVATR
jgi:hypothetical protein